MKNILLIVFTCILSFVLIKSEAQVLTGNPVDPSIPNQNPFFDASTNHDPSVTFENNNNKGLVFPRTDLTQWEFKTDLLDGSMFPTAFDGMIVYNVGTGSTLSGQGQVVSVTPGFYYFYNPTGTIDISDGYWIKLGSGGANIYTADGTINENRLVDLNGNNIAFGDAGNVKVGENPQITAPSALMELESTTKGILFPRLKTSERNAISSPVEGLMLFNTTTKCLEMYVNNAWYSISCPAASIPPSAPLATSESNVDCSSFNANWNASVGATLYYLDVVSDTGFTSFITGYENLNVGNVTSYNVTGLNSGTDYYYRVRASSVSGVSDNSAKISLTTSNLPSASFSYTETPYCSSASNPLPSFSGGGVAGTFSSTPGLVFISTTSGQIDLSTSTAGNYTVTNTIAAAGGCSLVTATTDIAIVFCCGTSQFTDIRDGQSYNSIQIGDQCWMKQNLKYLPSVIAPSTGSSTVPYNYVFGYYGTDTTAAKANPNYNTYGVLYNWPAAMNGGSHSTNNPSGVQGICPSGWHLPSKAEWIELTDFLGGQSVAGGKLKETGTVNWNSPNTAATNETDFTAIPGGDRNMNGDFVSMGLYGHYWTTSLYNSNQAWFSYTTYNTSSAPVDFVDKYIGFSVRCLKD
ncbi:MAG: FISUMP domain-containing protein [Bacteroidales bacterium]|nr:FISUMP domain-containing protein [Bacteroidales bacterium]